MPPDEKGCRPSRRILHTSDLHLDEPGKDARDSLEAVVGLAIERSVDLVIIAGDLFDHGRIEDELVGFTVAQLHRLPMPVVVLPGNHDCLIPDSVFERADFRENDGNIHLITSPEGETLELPGLGVSVWGKCIDSHDDVRPLEGIPPPDGDRQWNVAVAHGYYVSTNPPLFPSYHITRDEIVASDRDYIALGHIPVFRCICHEPVVAYYCGSPSVSGTVALVELDDKTGVQVTPVELK
jgi:exonuclease SbcD